MERLVVGTAENVEAEYGATDMFGNPFVVFQLYDDEPVSIEGFETKEAAIASVASADRSIIEWMF